MRNLLQLSGREPEDTRRWCSAAGDGLAEKEAAFNPPLYRTSATRFRARLPHQNSTNLHSFIGLAILIVIVPVQAQGSQRDVTANESGLGTSHV
jgi:hypothetical protein